MSDSSTTPFWDRIALHAGILREPTPERQRLVVWMPGENDGRYRYWSRIGTVPHAEIAERDGFCSVAANLMPARQPVPRFLDKLFRLFRRSSAEQSWVLPNGETVEPFGERQTAMLLVWAKDGRQPPDESQLWQLWPDSVLLKSLGPNLLLLGGVTAAASDDKPVGSLPTDDESRMEAEKWLIAARQKGDRVGEASALADLGVLALEQRDNPRAVACLENALTIAQSLGDRTRELDILPNLGLATLRVQQPDKAQQFLERALNMAHAAGDRYAEKFALERLATVYATRANLPETFRLLGEALSIARSLSDRQHEADLLWHIGIRQAESGQKEQALSFSRAAIQLMESMGNPEARVYREHLQKFEQSDAVSKLQEAASHFANDVVVSSTMNAGNSPNNLPTDRTGPGYLRMAISAAKAFTRFVGSGLKTVSAQTLENRLRECTPCPHHTGMRCRICGCFTNLKARLPHERCPIGKWDKKAN